MNHSVWEVPEGLSKRARSFLRVHAIRVESLVIGPGGEFGLRFSRWVPLQASIEGWVESVALSYHAAMWAEKITKVQGAAVDELSLDGFEQIPEVAGLADTWWRGEDSLVAIYRGEAECFSGVRYQKAYVYSGLSDWGLHGG